jgi:hypothetical protein
LIRCRIAGRPQFAGAFLILQLERDLILRDGAQEIQQVLRVEADLQIRPLYSLVTVSSLSPISTDDEKIFTSPSVKLHADGARTLVGELRHALDGGADLVLLQLRDVRGPSAGRAR